MAEAYVQRSQVVSFLIAAGCHICRQALQVFAQLPLAFST